MQKFLVDFKVTLKIVTRLNYCFQTKVHTGVRRFLSLFFVIRAGESSFNLSRAVVLVIMQLIIAKHIA